MSTLKTDNISPNGSVVNVTSVLNVQGGATLAAVKITGNLDVDGNVFGVNATTNTVTVSSPANTTPVLLIGVSANSGTTHRSILRFGHDQNSSSIPVGEIHGVVDNTAGASQRAGHIEFSTANAGVTAERMRIESTGKIVVNAARGDVGAGTVLTGQNALGTIHFVQNTINDNWVGMTTSATSTPTISQGGILIQGSGGYGTKIHFLTTDSYAAGQKNRMTIDHFGNVGIGTESPTDRLNIHTAAATDNILRFTNSTSGTGGGNGFILGQFSNADCYVWNEEPTNILFATSGTERMRLTNDGRLNIGTSNPVANTPLLVSGAGDGISSIRLQIPGVGGLNYGSLIVSGSQATTVVEPKWINSFVLEGVPLADSTGASGSTIISSFDRDLQFHTGNRAEQMRITKNGNVGIGITAPGASLDVKGTLKVGNFGSTTNVMPKAQTTSTTSVGFYAPLVSSNTVVTLPSSPAGGKWMWFVYKTGGTVNSGNSGIGTSGEAVWDFDNGTAHGFALLISLS